MSRATILAVDDKIENIAIITSVLESDYKIIGASNGDMALTIARYQAIDLILLDLMMPGMDGYEVCRELKADDRTRDIPVIIITGSEQPNAEVDVFEIGAVDYITKPIKHLVLSAHVRTHLALSDANKKLAIQNKMLIEAARLRDDVEQITKHDLKSPLNVIIVAPQLLLMDGSCSERQRNLYNQIKDAGYRMLEMINTSLDIYKMENGSYIFTPSPINIVDVLRTAWGELAPNALAKHLRISVSVDGQHSVDHRPVYVMAESLLCHSMLSNLLKNAIEASPCGDIITIEIQSSLNVDITIENGGEVPIEIRDRFFERLVTSGKTDGTGLGTYSAMLIAKTHNGHIALDTSNAGRTSIRITLPSFVDVTLPPGGASHSRVRSAEIGRSDVEASTGAVHA
ncbi:histidine kinase [Azospirillaceae bacterium]